VRYCRNMVPGLKRGAFMIEYSRRDALLMSLSA
jgi:hypothetical protein